MRAIGRSIRKGPILYIEENSCIDSLHTPFHGVSKGSESQEDRTLLERSRLLDGHLATLKPIPPVNNRIRKTLDCEGEGGSGTISSKQEEQENPIRFLTLFSLIIYEVKA